MSVRPDGGGHDVQREKWEARWAKPRAWRLSRHSPPAQVRLASDQQWFPGGAPILEIGCGMGDTAAWLARNGHDVTAIDISSTAVRMACRAHPGEPRLRFAEHDICGDPPPGGPFSALLDWGCLHSVPASRREAYAHNLAAVSEEDARLLMFHRARPGADKSVVVAVEGLLGREFVLVEAETCLTFWGSTERAGVALRFRRRGA